MTNENRTGTRVLGTGAYERWNEGTGLAHTIDRFIVYGAELPEPLDYRTLGVAAGVGVQRERWLAEVEYGLTRFRNFEDVLLWDNPFRITDAAQVTGGLDRSRFAVGQLVLPPNSLSQEVTASAATDLPLHGRLAASLSYGIVTQDDAFLPYTRNSAIAATDAAGNPVGPASTAALPAHDLGGDVRTIAGSLSATARPLRPLTMSAKYRVYRYDNQSREVTFPGYAAFGESGWRRERNDVTSGLDAPVANELLSYWRHEAELGFDVKLTRMVSLALEGGWEGWRFTHARLDGLDEYSVGAGVTVKPARNASLKARYRFSDRQNDGYLRGATAENPEARGLLNYNWSDRRRHRADVRAQVSPSRLLSVGLAATGRIGPLGAAFTHQAASLFVMLNSLRLLRLVNNLLDFAQIEAGKLRAAYRRVNLRAATRELCASFESSFRDLARNPKYEPKPTPATPTVRPCRVGSSAVA